MKKIGLTIIILFIALGNLSARHKKQKTVNSKIQSIYMRRTACFGKCPDYIVEISNTGKVKYTGNHFVKDSGVFEKNFSTVNVQRLFDEFTRFQIDTCQAQYESRIQDLPGIIYKISYKDRVQSINSANFGPVFLRNLALSVDSFAQVDKSWKKIRK